MDRLLRALGISWKVARYIAICSFAFLLLLAWLAWSFQNSPAGLTAQDRVVFIGMGLFAAVVLFASGWQGFTAAGRRYSEQLFDRERKEHTVMRIAKVAFATGAMAFVVSEVLFIALLFIGGSGSVMIFFEGKTEGIIYGALYLLCLPVALKYLK